jgi:catechol 2,3-dioxygenase-like lactoylglutathione lyase family enzyme
VIRRLDHVQVSAPPGCEDAARRFYAGLLGMTEVPKPPGLVEGGGAWFRAGDAELHVGVSDDHTGAAKAHPAFGVDRGELAALASRLDRSGSEVVWDRRISGVPRFYVLDPFGNRVEITGK